MTITNDELNKQILSILKFDGDEQTFRLQVIELLSELLSIMHWQRGLFYYLKFQGKFNLSEVETTNYNRLLDNMSDYEQLMWDQLPSRILTNLLINYRRGLGIPSLDELSKLDQRDPHGRVPYDLSAEEFDIIEKTLAVQLDTVKGRRKAGEKIDE